MGMIIPVICAYVIFLVCFIVLRNATKKKNPKHSFLDDFLLFTSSPVLFAYILIVAFNPNNADKIVHDLFATPLTYSLMAWGLLSTVWYSIRYYKNVPKSKKAS